MYAVSNALHPLKALLPNVVTLLGMLMLFSLVHSLNADPPMTAHPSLMVTDVRLMHPSNTSPSISSRFGLSSAEVSDVHPRKAADSSFLMLLGQLMLLRLVHLKKAR